MKMFRLMAVVLLLGTACSAWAETKIAVVDIRAAIFQTDQAKLKLEKLKTSLSRDQADAIALKNELEKLAEKRQKDAAIMGQDELRDLEKQIEDKKIDFNYKAQKLEKSQKEAMQEVFNSMLPKVEQELQDMTTKGKYDLILQREAAVWADPKLDITKDLIDRLNKSK